MKKKKESFWKTIGIALVGTSFILLMATILAYLMGDSFSYCKLHPSECVCEEYGCVNTFDENKIEIDLENEKSECEKSNPDYIKVIHLVEKYSGFNINGTMMYCDEYPYSWNNQTLYNEFCREIETTCREKTDYEKLLDKDCETLDNYIHYGQPIWHLFSHYYNSEELKQAWREKGCEI